MAAYALRRLLLAVPILWGVITLTFFLLRVVPADPAATMLGPHMTAESRARIIREMHLDKPLLTQYGYFLADLCRGNLGYSYRWRETVTGRILAQFPRTVILALAAMTIATVLGVLGGLLSALHQGRWLDQALRLFSLTFISMPSFVLAILMSMGFGYWLRWFPINGFRGGPEGWVYLCLPALALGTRPMATILRLTRASLLEVIRQDYIRTARAKGVGPATVAIVHALRNSLIPVATAISGNLATLLGGALFIEIVFSWPGLGKLSYDAISNSDFAVVQGTVLFSAAVFVAVNLIMDLLYAVLDPRIQYG